MIVPFLTSTPACALRSAPNLMTVEHPFASSVAVHLLSMLHYPSFFLCPFPHHLCFYYVDSLLQCAITVVFVGLILFAFDYVWFFIVFSLCLPSLQISQKHRMTYTFRYHFFLSFFFNRVLVSKLV